MNTFGVFQAYYKDTLLPNTSESTISWIGSLSAFLLCSTTILAGPLFDRGHARPLVYAGSFLIVLGLMMTSLCTTYYQLILAQALCQGIGQGALFITSVAIIPSYFSTRRSLALGIAASGSSLGGVIYTIVFHNLLPTLGFGWTTRVLGFIALATLLVPCILIHPRPVPISAQKKKIVDITAFKELPFSLFSLASFTGFIGLYIPFFYITAYATHLGLNSELAFYILPLMSAGSIPGRVLPSFIADRALGPLSILMIFTLLAGVLGFAWIAVDSAAGVIVWAIAYGAASGAFVSLQPSAVVSITDPKYMGSVGGRLGMNTFCSALGLLIGTPVAGVLLAHDATFLSVQVFCGAVTMGAAVLMVWTRWVKVGWGLGSRA